MTNTIKFKVDVSPQHPLRCRHLPGGTALAGAGAHSGPSGVHRRGETRDQGQSNIATEGNRFHQQNGRVRSWTQSLQINGRADVSDINRDGLKLYALLQQKHFGPGDNLFCLLLFQIFKNCLFCFRIF